MGEHGDQRATSVLERLTGTALTPSSCLCFPAAGITSAPLTPGILHGDWGPNSGSYGFWASILRAESSPSPSVEVSWTLS